MYFASRMQAGRLLAAQLAPKYRYENCAVIALNDGGVMVGAQIASELHCVLMMILSEEVHVPLEPIAVGGMTQDGNFSYNQAYSSGELEEITSEYHGFIEQEKMNTFHQLNRLVGSGGILDTSLLRGHNVILVSDGFEGSFLLDMAMQFLKPISTEKVIIVTPLANVEAVDRMHILADEIICLSVPVNFLNVAHYYDQQDIPDHDTVIKTIENIVLNWK